MPKYATPNDAYTEVYAAGNKLACLVCGGEAFLRREIKLQTTGMSFIGLDWANRSGDGAVCRQCGFVHTFFHPVEWRVPEAGSQA
jgi:predicted nucleic-acid-binding Zn-ribbon protein